MSTADLIYRLRATGINLCDEAADMIEAQAHEIKQWKLGSEVVFERAVAPYLDSQTGDSRE